MKINEFSSYLARLEATSSRLKMTQILADLFAKADKEEIDKITYLLTGSLAPSYRGVVFNIAERMMTRIIAQSFAVGTEFVKRAYKQKGDLGDVAFALAETKKVKEGKTEQLFVSGVYGRLMEIAQESGAGSQERKVDKMALLLSQIDPRSIRYIVRIPIEKMRLGFSDMTILDALSVVAVGDKSARGKIEDSFNVTPDIGRIAKRIKEKGLSGVKRIEPEPGIPVRPSLAERLPQLVKIFEKLGKKVAVEPKYDGFRCAVHLYREGREKKARIFSRNLEDTTHMFPDLVEAVKKIKLKSAIFDAEAIAYDAKNNRFLPFQETAQRKRKHKIEEAVKKFPLKLFLFDILYKDGKSLLGLPFSQRRKILVDSVSKVDRVVEVTRQDTVTSAKVIRDLIKEYLGEGLEGALIKKIDAPYKAGARGYHWVKYKKTSAEGVADTVDCLVMGVYRGKGKRAGFGAGAFLVGVRVVEEGRSVFKTVSKIGTGLTDKEWRELNQRTKELKDLRKPEDYMVNKNLEPDLWTRPSLVVEILADEITKSPIHSAGLALRFPRLIRFRDDKGPQDATTVSELQKLFKMQKILN